MCVTSSIRSRVSKKKLCSLKDNATAAFVRWNKCLSTQTNASSRSEIPKITAQELMDDSRVFLGKPNLSPQQFSSQSAQLFNKWRHILFTIPHTELEMLDEITRCIDGLVRNVLQKQEMRMSASQSPLVLGLPDNIVDFVCTGIYAWGRVAPHDKFAPIMAEYMYAALLELFEKSEQNRCFQPSEGVYSALAYCWSQTENEDSAPEKALKYLNIIEKDPTMVVQTPTFNSVLRAFARQGRAEEVEQLVESITAEKDVHTYEILVQAWMRSNVPDGPNKAYIVLQDGIQNSLRAENEDITPLTELFGRFLNMNNRNPKICDQVLNQMILLQEEHPSVEILQPRHFIITMSAWSSKGEAEKVEQLFRKIRQLYKNGNRNLQPSYQVSQSN